MWTGENDSNTLRVDGNFFKNGEKNLRSQRYPYTCGQGLNEFPIQNKNTSRSLPVKFRETRRLHRRSLRLPTRRKWGQSGYLCTTPSTAQAGADAGFLGLKVGGGVLICKYGI